ncbi:MAG: Tim44-like domain-containing protein [Zoogloea sp.]|uniref:Tim44 domain-containing protein n=1 Tax=Zoogloea sp. TaxID=49181 RepID=UPI0026203BAF|nr:Tim44-like domain-containing protein [Zoogloea sp.]MDD3325752.1 Tim44-like domain-containing protein [Zoogloea sp.]
MKSFALLTATLALGLTLATGDADAAKRFGGGKSSGMQRQELSQPKAPTATPATPAQAPTAAAAPNRAQQAGAPAAPQAQPKRSWMGPLAGLAAGIGLAALASHFGFGEELASMMMMGLIAVAVMMLIGFFMRRRAAAQQPAMAGAGAGAMNYTGSNLSQHGGGTSQPAYAAASSPEPAPADAQPARSIPADFDAEAFVRNAKVNFIRLQAANDARNLEDIREYTTPELFAEIKMNWMEQGGGTQKTDVVSLNAEVLDVTEEVARYIVSVRFTGLLREEANAAPEAIDETWHLTKPRSGNSGWLVAGVQQNA